MELLVLGFVNLNITKLLILIEVLEKCFQYQCVQHLFKENIHTLIFVIN